MRAPSSPGAPSWAARPAAGTVATMLLRRVSRTARSSTCPCRPPATCGTCTPADAEAAWQSLVDLDGHGLDPAAEPAKWAAVARHLTVHQGLPTEPGELVVTAGAQEALWLVTRVLPRAPGC